MSDWGRKRLRWGKSWDKIVSDRKKKQIKTKQTFIEHSLLSLNINLFALIKHLGRSPVILGNQDTYFAIAIMTSHSFCQRHTHHRRLTVVSRSWRSCEQISCDTPGIEVQKTEWVELAFTNYVISFKGYGIDEQKHHQLQTYYLVDIL